MAEAPRNRLPFGYDEDFVDAVDDENLGLICHLPLKEPVLTRCGHRFCKECLEEYFRRQEAQGQPITCPADRKGLDRDRDIFPDLPTERKILSFAIKCPSEGCEWTGELRSKEIHLASCLFKLVHCTNENCHVTIQRRELEEHVTINCTWRILACDHCSEQHSECNMKKHFDICRKVPLLCTNKCGVRDIPREKLEVHILDECPATEVHCEYKNLGCEAVFPRSDAKSHSKTHIESHLNLALRGLEATQHQVHELVTVVKDQSQQIERQSQQIERQSQQIERMISKDKEQSRQIERQSGQIERLISNDKEQFGKMERLMSRVEDQSQQIKQLISKDKEPSEKVERSIFTVQGQPPQRERSGPINQIFPTPFEWKIPNIRKVASGSQSLISKPFYLFERGYKYLLQIKTFRPSKRQIDLKVYIKVVPGEFDEMLSWPCKEKVCVTRKGLCYSYIPRLENYNSNVIDFEKCKEPCSRPLNDDHHEYRQVLDFTVGYYLMDDVILIRVNRE